MQVKPISGADATALASQYLGWNFHYFVDHSSIITLRVGAEQGSDHAKCYDAGMSRHILLIDGTGLIFRAYFSIKGDMTTPAGVPVNAVFGVLRLLLKIFRDAHATDSAIVFDAGSKTFRNDMYDGYKANRPAPPDDLRPQFGMTIDLARACGAPVYSLAGFEADDIIATLAADARRQGHNVSVLTSDRDLLQLLDPSTQLLMPGKMGAVNTVNLKDFEHKYGFPHERFVDFKALMGDPSDNIPGVPGVGEKTAAKLVSQHGKLETIYSNMDFIKPESLRRKLEPARDDVYLFRDLVTVKRDVPVSYDYASRTMPHFGTDEFIELLASLGFNRVQADSRSMGDLQSQ
jgi:DNA polymerase-1